MLQKQTGTLHKTGRERISAQELGGTSTVELLEYVLVYSKLKTDHSQGTVVQISFISPLQE